MQISVEVAISEVRIFTAEEYNGFVTTVFGYELVGPKCFLNWVKETLVSKREREAG